MKTQKCKNMFWRTCSRDLPPKSTDFLCMYMNCVYRTNNKCQIKDKNVYIFIFVFFMFRKCCHCFLFILLYISLANPYSESAIIVKNHLVITIE